MRTFLLFIGILFLYPSLYSSGDYLVPSEIQVSSSHQFMQSETPSLSLMEGIPNVVVHNHVHVITGSFFDHQTDLEMGALQFDLDRTYISSDNSRGSLMHGWNHNHEEVLNTESHPNHRYAVSKGKSGGEFLYRGRFGVSDLSIDAKNFKRGLTNCNGNEISGRTNAINHHLKRAPDEKYILSTGSGCNMVFEKIYGQKHFYQIESKKTPSQHRVAYSYDSGNRRVKKVDYQNPQKQTLSSLNFSYPGKIELKNYAKKKQKGNKRPTIKVTAADGRQVQYVLEAFEKQTCDVDTDVDHIRYRVAKVRRPNAPNESYVYSKPTCCIPEQVILKKRPEGRYVQLEYYDKGKFLKGKVKSIMGPAGTNASPVNLYTFLYEKESDTSATTYVKDGLGHRTIYHYSPKNFRLNSIEKFYGSSPHYSLHSIEKLEWGGNEHESNLVSRNIYDASQNLVLGRRYEYDERGNVLRSHLDGCITGKCPMETFTKTFTYSNDGFNLATTIVDGSVRHEISYKPESDLIIAKFTVAGSYQLREFYEYDVNNAVTSIVNDDGLSKDRNDLTGVTQRTIQRMINLNGTFAGLPETTEYLYYDLTTGNEVLLKKIVCRYDGLGRLIEELTYDSDSNYKFSKKWEYNNYGQKTLEVDAEGQTTLYTYDLNGNMLTESRLSDNRLKRYTYDLCNRVVKQEIIRGNETYVESFDYDVMGNKISSTDTYGNKTCYHYDSLGQLSTVIYPRTLDANNQEYERREFKEYDTLGNVSMVMDGIGFRTTTYYTVRGAPYLIEHPDGGKELFEYSLQGQLIKYTSPNGTIVRTEYDELSRPITEQTYASSGELLLSKKKRYTPFHLIEEDNGDGLLTSYSYDGAGRVIQIVQGNYVQSIAYDSLGRQEEVRSFFGSDFITNSTKYDYLDRIVAEYSTNSSGDVQHYRSYEYDVDGNRIAVKTINLSGESTERSEYNALGQLIKKVDPLSHVTTLIHDTLTQNGSTVYRVITIDPLGNQKIQVHNELGFVNLETHLNAMGQILKQTEFGYDHAGNRTLRIDSVISPVGIEKRVKTLWEYDAMNRLTSTSEAYGSNRQRTISRRYDLSGNIVHLNKADGVTFNYHYDPLGRLKEYYSSDQSVHYYFEYNPADKPIKIEDRIHNSVTIRNYNENQQLIEEILANGLTLKYEYDSLGRVTLISYPDGTLTVNEYNGNHLHSVHRKDIDGNIQYTHTYSQYDMTGNVVRSELIGDLGTVSVDYDLMNRVQRIQTPVWDEKGLTYNSAGNLVYREWDNLVHTFSYDDLNQIKSESGFVENTFVNDSMYNQIEINQVPRAFNEAYELENRYQYDRNGNVIQKDDLNFEYDALNRLTKVTGNNVDVAYFYDSFHRRISKVGEVTERYLYSGDLEIGVVNDLGVITQLRILGNHKYAEIGAAIAVELDGVVYAPLHDTQGNLVTLVDVKTGSIVESCRYSAYGQEIADKSFGRLSPWRYASKRFDEETGFTNFGRRYYDSEELRWISLDPILISEGTNRYNYLENNPFRYVDPDGRWFFFIPLMSWGGSALTVTVATLTVTEVAMIGAASVAVCGTAYVAKNYDVPMHFSNSWRFNCKPQWSNYNTRYIEEDYRQGCRTRPRGGLLLNFDESLDDSDPSIPGGTMGESEAKPKFPGTPQDLLNDSEWKDVSHPNQKPLGHCELENMKTGERIRYDKGKPGFPGNKGKDHYHKYNPKSNNPNEYYIDASGQPCPKNSPQSHLFPPNGVNWFF